MPEYEVPVALWVLMGTTLFLVVLVWMSQLRTSGRLRRIEAQLSRNPAGSEAGESSLGELKSENKEQKRLYQEFLDEQPARRDLPKKDQFAAFRKWRSDKGLNWSGEDKPA